MKIGIVTMWNAMDNYGGILQTYALQKYLRNQGHDAYVIRFVQRFGWEKELKTFIKNILCKIGLYQQSKWEIAKNKAKERSFDIFRKNYISLSKREYHTLNDIRKHYPQADAYITGSDQVWARNIEKNPFEKRYYLDFGLDATMRIAYAVSFGSADFPCGDLNTFKKLVNHFNKVSVRENKGIEFCNKIGTDAVRCVDPTMLLNAEVYKGLMKQRKHSEDYAYFYTVNVSSPEEIYWAELRDYFQNTGITSVVTTASGYKSAEEIFPDAEYDYSTVEEWLANIYYAKVVITASFHGVVFSILFKKDFIYIPLKSILSIGNDRIYDLLHLYGMESRIANNSKDVISLAMSHCKYSDNVSSITKFIIASKAFLDI